MHEGEGHDCRRPRDIRGINSHGWRSRPPFVRPLGWNRLRGVPIGALAPSARRHEWGTPFGPAGHWGPMPECCSQPSRLREVSQQPGGGQWRRLRNPSTSQWVCGRCVHISLSATPTKRSTSTVACSRPRNSNVTPHQQAVSPTQNFRSARRSSRSASTQMPTAESLTVCRASDSASTSQTSMRPMHVRWQLARLGTLPQTACRAHVRRVSTTPSASPGGLLPLSLSGIEAGSR